jgi:DNA transformation protein and related proteins
MDPDHLHDLFSAFGTITIKRMFGGQAVYSRSGIIGVVFEDSLLMKADEQSAPHFAAAGGERWRYAKDGREVNMPYWSIPSSAMDDPEEMAVWARLADEAALRAAQKPKKPAKAKPA